MLFSNANKAPKVSILVPIYNTSKYLPECLDSLLGQTLKDIEIVCINDGSTDNSPDLIREYQKRDSRALFVAERLKLISFATHLRQAWARCIWRRALFIMSQRPKLITLAAGRLLSRRPGKMRYSVL